MRPTSPFLVDPLPAARRRAAGRASDGTLEILPATSAGIVQSLDEGAWFRPLDLG